MAFNPSDGVFSGFEGVVTPDVLDQQRQLDRQRARAIRQTQKSGERLFAAEAGAFAGQAITDALRRLAPGTFDRRRERAVEAQNIISAARKRVADASQSTEGGASSLINQRLRAVQEARIMARARGLDSLADQLAGNELQLANQAAELRKLGLETRETELDIETKEQNIGLKALGDPDTIQRVEGDDTVFDAQILPGGRALFVNSDGNYELLEPGQYVSAELTGGPADFQEDKTAVRKVTDQLSAGFAMSDSLLALRNQIVQNPEVATLSNQFAATLGDLADQARASISEKFPDGDQRVRQNESLLSDFFQEAQIQDDVFKARVSNLAFLIAGTRENGRFTDRDIQQAAIALGQGPNPESRIAAMDDLLMSTVNRLEFQFNALPERSRQLAQGAFDGFQNKIGQYQQARQQFFVPIPGREETAQEGSPEPGPAAQGDGSLEIIDFSDLPE